MKFLLTLLVSTFSIFLLNLKISESATCTNWEKPVFVANYTPQGKMVTLAGMETYETGNLNSSKVLIAVYDAFGFNPGPNDNIRQTCDRLGEYGYHVVMPDFFHGIPWNWSEIHYNEKTPSQWNADIQANPTWNETKIDVALVIEEFKTKNISNLEFGIFGMCFGGKMTGMALGDFADDIKIGAQFHPAVYSLYDSLYIKRPVLLLPGASDPDMTDYCNIVNILNGEGTCRYHHFRDVNHGYAGGGADWTNTTIRTRAEEAVGLWEQFLCELFPVD